MSGTTRTSVQATIAAFILCCAAMPITAAEQAVSNKVVAKYLTEAKDLAGGKRWDAAWGALEKAERVADLSPYEKAKIDEYKAYVLTQQHKYAEAGALFEQLAKSESASAQERNDKSVTTVSRKLRSSICARSSTRNRRVRRKQLSRNNRTIPRSWSLPVNPNISPEIIAAQLPEPLSSWRPPCAKEVSRGKHRCKYCWTPTTS
jgi:hypothetical protein